MPTEAQSLLSAGFAIIQAQFPSVVTGNNASVTGVCTPIVASEIMRENGFDIEYIGTVVLTTADALSVGAVANVGGVIKPVRSASITVEGESSRVKDATVSATDPTVEVHFKHAR